MADQFGSPTFSHDLASAIGGLVRLDAQGILHVTNAGFCSWFEFAREILRQARRDSIRVLPIITPQAGRPAKRPAYSVLSPASLYAHGMKLRSWQEATGAYLEELRQKGKLVCNSDRISKVANLYFVCLFEARSTSPRRVTAPKGKDS